ncbi:SRPBCC family protein [Algoriphagus sanaruensis]|nr:SRPBCC family protein [Algoriphagus sanaruensis]
MKKMISLLFVFIVGLGIFTYVQKENSFKKYIEQASANATHQIPANPKAPVFAQGEIVIASSPEKVWDALTQINEWPSWQSDVTEAKIQGPVVPGAIFTWRAGGISFQSEIHTAKTPNFLGWTGKTIGAYAVHNWTLSEFDGQTLVQVEESLEGFLPSLLKGFFQKNLEAGIQKNLEDLRQEIEK